MIMNKMKIASLLLLIAIFSFTAVDSHADGPNSFLQRHIRNHVERVRPPIASPASASRLFLPLEKTSAGNELTISESVAPARFDQDYSDIARLSDGRMIACWEDSRNGIPMIYAQVLATDGNPSGSNFPVAESNQSFRLIEPKAVSDGSGGFYIVWRELDTGRLMAKRFDSELNLAAGPFEINDISDGSYAGIFDVASFPGGPLIVAWENYTDVNRIAVRTFTTSGSPLINTTTVTTNTDLALNWEPSVALDTITSTIGVAWEGKVGTDNPTVYMQYINIDGSLFGDNFTPVGAGALDDAQVSPMIAFNAFHKFIVTWLDDRDGFGRVYLQRAGRTSGLIGTNTPVSDGNSYAILDHDLSAGESSFVSGWITFDGDAAFDLSMQRFNNGAVADGSVDTGYSATSGYIQRVALDYDDGGNLHTLWTDNETDQKDIYFQRFSPDGTPLRIEVSALNDDAIGANSIHADIATIDDSRAVAVFTDQRNDDGDIFLQFVNSNNTLDGVNIKLNDDVIDFRQDYPAVAVAPDGSFLAAAWLGYTAPGGVFGERAYLEIDPLTDPFVSTAEFMIEDITNIRSPRVAISGNSKIFTIFCENFQTDGKLYGRIFNSDGSSDGSSFVIETGTINEYDIDRNDNDIFTVSYILNPLSAPAAAFVRYNNTGTEIGRFNTTGDVSGVEIEQISTAVSSTGIIYLLWRGDDDNLYLTSLDINGAVLESSFLVNDDPDAEPDQIRLAVGTNGSLIASWLDRRDGILKMYYQVFEPNLTPASVNLPASTAPVYFMRDPAVAGNNSKIWLAWSDPREYGLNVIARQVDYVPTDVDDDDPHNLPSGFALAQNYPNPFNPTTEIEFSLPTRSDIELIVYDILGRKVRTLADGTYDAGKHSVTWDALDDGAKKVASGVYFYLLKGGDRHKARKMILLK